MGLRSDNYPRCQSDNSIYLDGWCIHIYDEAGNRVSIPRKDFNEMVRWYMRDQGERKYLKRK